MEISSVGSALIQLLASGHRFEMADSEANCNYWSLTLPDHSIDGITRWI